MEQNIVMYFKNTLNEKIKNDYISESEPESKIDTDSTINWPRIVVCFICSQKRRLCCDSGTSNFNNKIFHTRPKCILCCKHN